jgi:hypothetical protein
VSAFSSNVAARTAPGSASIVFTPYKRQTFADGSVAIAVRLFDGAAQLAKLVGLAEHDAWILRAGPWCGLRPCTTGSP